MNSDVLKRFNPSKKAATLLTCGAILVGATLNFGVGSVIPNLVLQSAEQTQRTYNDQSLSNNKDFEARVNEDKKFVKIESQLKSPFEYDVTASSVYVEEAQARADSHFLHELYPMVPGWSSYMNTFKVSDEISPESTLQTNRGMLWYEFKNTCDMVTDLDAGFDVSKARVVGVLADGSEGYTYKGKYVSGAGTTPENFETFLKGCGDENLKYLPELKAEQKRVADEQAIDDQTMNEESPSDPAESEQK